MNESSKPKFSKEIIIEEKNSQLTSSQQQTPSSFHSPLNLNAKNINLEQQLKVFQEGIDQVYASILEWLLNKNPSNINEPLMIDDSD